MSNEDSTDLHHSHRHFSRPQSTTPSHANSGGKHLAKTWSSNKTKKGGQLFLCIMGGAISASIGVWMAAFSQDFLWRRILFAIGAGICACLFGLLAFSTAHRSNRLPPRQEDSARLGRSTTTSSMRLQHGGGGQSVRRVSANRQTSWTVNGNNSFDLPMIIAVDETDLADDNHAAPPLVVEKLIAAV